MTIVYSVDDFKTVFKTRDISAETALVKDANFFEGETIVEKKGYRESYKSYGIDGVGIALITRDNSHDFGYKVNSDFPYIQMHFEFMGSALYTPDSSREQNIEIVQGTHTLFYLPNLNGKLIYPAIHNGFSAQIEVSLDFLNRVFNYDLSVLGKFYEDILNERPSVLGNRPRPITRHIQNILLDMNYCPFVGIMKKIYFEGKLLELLTTQINDLTSGEENRLESNFRAKEIEVIKAARDIIQNNFSHPYSLDELSRLVGTNRTKLQKDFKSFYGYSIFELIKELRMNWAKELLTSGNHIKIQEIATKIGYKNANHFSTAFKNKFGLLPKHYKTNLFS